MAIGNCVVYWLYDEHCICLWRHGYIGTTYRLTNRLREHHRERKFPSNFKHQIVFSGTRQECVLLEGKLRPEGGIGWNRSGGGGIAFGFKHSDEFRKAMSERVLADGRFKKKRSAEWRANAAASARARYSDPAERERMAAAVKKGKRKSRSGANNPMFGKRLSAEHRQKISVALHGKCRRKLTKCSQFDFDF